ncbi:single-stranded DNA-binding protein [Flavobacterium sp. Root901]|uniref:single-stranded DNA-binding protein n=1 Tax=Flavobacterium sp. Root901 TaxID=1736605 RepID=UPI000AE97444|nr:single-stranded DNA-binding protein [Flavobacterium sp. Root901]
MEITGRIVKDASAVKVKENRQVVNFSIAANDSYKPKAGTEVKKMVTIDKRAHEKEGLKKQTDNPIGFFYFRQETLEARQP